MSLGLPLVEVELSQRPATPATLATLAPMALWDDNVPFPAPYPASASAPAPAPASAPPPPAPPHCCGQREVKTKQKQGLRQRSLPMYRL